MAARRQAKIYAPSTEPINRLKPKYGHWVIFDHGMPFDVAPTRIRDSARFRRARPTAASGYFIPYPVRKRNAAECVPRR
jgi:hypothetical protein